VIQDIQQKVQKGVQQVKQEVQQKTKDGIEYVEQHPDAIGKAMGGIGAVIVFFYSITI
jgi:hypothetical protein